ncbi:MAG: hypothetical protein A2283_02010 [Lentisphaerae bacterium RIFOXYA12_FULL_48_11]|nr:MAG: hypothetical protein A2283_02010 [Lentisphaerae bacterium RIFOXYA12_FULL_48_11]
MNTKLTLRMDTELIRTAKEEAGRRGKSVSKIVGEFFDSLASGRRTEQELPPVTKSLIGILKDRDITESEYRKHLREKYS